MTLSVGYMVACWHDRLFGQEAGFLQSFPSLSAGPEAWLEKRGAAADVRGACARRTDSPTPNRHPAAEHSLIRRP
jgi:hypothetical protein